MLHKYGLAPGFGDSFVDDSSRTSKRQNFSALKAALRNADLSVPLSSEQIDGIMNEDGGVRDLRTGGVTRLPRPRLAVDLP